MGTTVSSDAQCHTSHEHAGRGAPVFVLEEAAVLRDHRVMMEAGAAVMGHSRVLLRTRIPLELEAINAVPASMVQPTEVVLTTRALVLALPI